jgi:hypothetical protein
VAVERSMFPVQQTSSFFNSDDDLKKVCRTFVGYPLRSGISHRTTVCCPLRCCAVRCR